MTEKTIGILIGLYALIVWIVIFFVFHKGYKEWKQNHANRLRKHQARILDKREVKSAEGAPRQFILFGFDSRQMEFAVEPSVFSALKVGEEGTLVLRGGRFDSFEPKTQNQREDEIYRRMIKD